MTTTQIKASEAEQDHTYRTVKGSIVTFCGPVEGRTGFFTIASGEGRTVEVDGEYPQLTLNDSDSDVAALVGAGRSVLEEKIPQLTPEQLQALADADQRLVVQHLVEMHLQQAAPIPSEEEKAQAAVGFEGSEYWVGTERAPGEVASAAAAFRPVPRESSPMRSAPASSLPRSSGGNPGITW